jgi:hypothetical protein
MGPILRSALPSGKRASTGDQANSIGPLWPPAWEMAAAVIDRQGHALASYGDLCPPTGGTAAPGLASPRHRCAPNGKERHRTARPQGRRRSTPAIDRQAIPWRSMATAGDLWRAGRCRADVKPLRPPPPSPVRGNSCPEWRGRWRCEPARTAPACPSLRPFWRGGKPVSSSPSAPGGGPARML